MKWYYLFSPMNTEVQRRRSLTLFHLRFTAPPPYMAAQSVAIPLLANSMLLEVFNATQFSNKLFASKLCSVSFRSLSLFAGLN